jgi:hypothetical protein
VSDLDMKPGRTWHEIAAEMFVEQDPQRMVRLAEEQRLLAGCARQTCFKPFHVVPTETERVFFNERRAAAAASPAKSPSPY